MCLINKHSILIFLSRLDIEYIPENYDFYASFKEIIFIKHLIFFIYVFETMK